MFILPISRKPDWRNPPFITLLLILASCWVYFAAQSGDRDIARRSLEFYAASSLPGLEFARYARYLEAEGRNDDARQFRALLDRGQGGLALHAIQTDSAFMRELRSDRVVRLSDPAYARWRDERKRFESMFGRQLIERYAFVPAIHAPLTFISHMFLHGGLGHLVGNMLMLAIVGYMVEELLGHLRYLVFYLLGGLGAVGLYWATHAGQSVGLVGASGAIAGVMGLYTVLLGFRRIDFFYSILFWFDFVRAPAIVLLPLWIGNELFQLATNEGSPVAYAAHIGGLVAGALLGLLASPRRSPKLLERDARADDEAFEADLARAQTLVRKLSLDRARQAFAALATRRPADRRVLSQYALLARARPDGDDYRKAVSLILSLAQTDAATIALQADTFNNYAMQVKKLRLAPSVMFALASRFALHGRPAEAQRIACALVKHRPDHPELPAVLFRTAKALAAADDERSAAHCRKLLADLFPRSQEASLMSQAEALRRS